MISLVLVSMWVCAFLVVCTFGDPSKDYGVDVSYPIHHSINAADHPASALSYNATMEGCFSHYSEESCLNSEFWRRLKNRVQPALQHNYTGTGFKKMKLPQDTLNLLIDFYNTHREEEVIEPWPKSSTFTNHWASPTSMVSFYTLKGGSDIMEELRKVIKVMVEDWIGMEVEPTSLFGIRVYKRESRLATHVDRFPLITSAIVMISQEVDEDWPLEVYDRQGIAHNITMQPGDVVLYESHSLLHGRPFPLRGDYYANTYVHFKPKGHEERTYQVYESYVKNHHLEWSDVEFLNSIGVFPHLEKEEAVVDEEGSSDIDATSHNDAVKADEL